MVNKKAKKETNCSRKSIPCNGSGAIYGLGFIGALVYYITTASTLWIGVLGVLKSFLWPVFVIYESMKALGM